MRLASIVEYEGTDYHGFQCQDNVPSIQEELERAITRLTGEKVRVRAAGRTDAGVHARGQVIAFDTASNYSPDTFVRALNHYLPDTVAIRSAYSVDEGFDPRRDALSRTYRYTILSGSTPSPLLRRTTYRVGVSLDVDAMDRAAGLLVGRHDFARFSGPLEGPKASTEREVFVASAGRDGAMIIFDVEANAFLPHQVRRMAGSLVDVGRGALTLADIKSMIDGGTCEAVAHALPPEGLCLLKVAYANFPPRNGEPNGRDY